jgi:hypothetical protein
MGYKNGGGSGIFGQWEIRSQMEASPYTETLLATTAELNMPTVGSTAMAMRWHAESVNSNPTSGNTVPCRLKLVFKVRNASASAATIDFVESGAEESYVGVPFRVNDEPVTISSVLIAGDDANDNNIIGVRQLNFETFRNNGNSGSSVTIDWRYSPLQRVTLTANTVNVTFTNPLGPCVCQLLIKQDATGGRSFGTFTISGGGYFGGVADTLTTTADTFTWWELMFDGTNYWRKMLWTGGGGGIP